MLFRRLLAAILLILATVLALSVPATATGSNNHHKVWVCKYVGAPGDFETLKAGKQPIQVDVSAADAYVGADFADGQHHSYVIDLVTHENTDRHNNYTGSATCPTPEPTTTTTAPVVTTTTASVPETTTTTSDVEPTTTSISEPSTTTTTIVIEEPTTTLAPTTSTASSTSTTQPPTSTVVPSTSSTRPTPPTTGTSPSTTPPAPPSTGAPTEPTVAPPAELAYTGANTGLLWVAFVLLCLGVGLAVFGGSKRTIS